jgi:uncharacterized membrane protein (DUF4010 family)
MTSVPTLLITFALGVLCVCGQRPLALAIAVVVTAILAVKAPLHSFVRGLTPEEVMAAVKFGLVTLALLPLLPDRNYGMQDWPWLAERLKGVIAPETLERLRLLNPYKLWLVVVVISGIGFGGYVLVRLLGPNRGLLLTGLAGGLVSSTSVTLAMAEQSRRAPQWKDSFTAAILGACAVMAVRVLVMASVFDASLFGPLGLPLGLLMLASLVVASWLARRSSNGHRRSGDADGKLPVSTPLGLWPALQLAALMFFVRVISEVAVIAMGDKGLVVTAAISGIIDVDAITVASGQQSAARSVPVELAAYAICTAVAVNTISKALLVRLKGSPETAKTTFLALLASLVAGLIGFAIVRFTGLGAG